MRERKSFSQRVKVLQSDEARKKYFLVYEKIIYLNAYLQICTVCVMIQKSIFSFKQIKYFLFSKFQIQKIHALIPTNIMTRQEDLERFSCIGSLFWAEIDLILNSRSCGTPLRRTTDERGKCTT